jgi:hypothetical protein
MALTAAADDMHDVSMRTMDELMVPVMYSSARKMKRGAAPWARLAPVRKYRRQPYTSTCCQGFEVLGF